MKSWLGLHPTYRVATDDDCVCWGFIKELRAGDGGVWKPVPDYHPYIATGDSNGDGVEDFAVVVIDRSKREKNFVLAVFNGPFPSASTSPAFIQTGLNLGGRGLSYGPPRPKPYRLVLGPFESDNGALLIPKGNSYRWSAD